MPTASSAPVISPAMDRNGSIPAFPRELLLHSNPLLLTSLALVSFPLVLFASIGALTPLSPKFAARISVPRPSLPNPSTPPPIYLSHLTPSQHKILQHASAALLLKHHHAHLSAVESSKKNGGNGKTYHYDEIGLVVGAVVGGWKELSGLVEEGIRKVDSQRKNHRTFILDSVSFVKLRLIRLR